VLLVRKVDTKQEYAMKILLKSFIIEKQEVEHTKVGAHGHPVPAAALRVRVRGRVRKAAFVALACTAQRRPCSYHIAAHVAGGA
jgi:hypothetical protein